MSSVHVMFLALKYSHTSCLFQMKSILVLERTEMRLNKDVCRISIPPYLLEKLIFPVRTELTVRLDTAPHDHGRYCRRVCPMGGFEGTQFGAQIKAARGCKL